MSNRHPRRLSLEVLNARDLPAAFGIAWADASLITLSFAPDGTSVSGIPSTLTATLDGLMPRETWQATLRGAAQTWADAANLNIGFASDSGAAFGIDGETQGEPRFGDIRFAAIPMEGDALGEALPPDSLLTGTFAGDVFFNSTIAFTPNMLRSVALHEIGHALGLPPSTNPNSVMFNTFGDRTKLAPSDLKAIRMQYGAKIPDANEKGWGNNRLGTSTLLKFPGSDEGETPLVAFGALRSAKDVDVFRVKNFFDYTGPISVRLQTTRISMVTPRLTVLDNRGRIITQLDGVGGTGDTLTYTLPTSVASRTYYFRVEDVPGSVAQTGRFGLAVTFDNLVEPSDITVEEVLSGPYDRLGAEDIHDLFEHPERTLFNADDGSDDSAEGADGLPSERGAFGQYHFRLTASMADALDEDFFRILAPRNAGQQMRLTVTTRAIGQLGTTPKVEVYDRDGNLVPAQVLLNGNGRFGIQLEGIEPSRQYFLRVLGDAAGNFSLDATFRNQAVDLQSFASGSVTTAAPVDFKLYAARTQLFGFAMTGNGPAGSAIQFAIKNLDGTTVFSLTAQAGETITGLSQFLAPGEYDVQLIAIGTTQPVSFVLSGAVVTDPLGPQPNNSTLKPIYQDPNNPGQYLYPGGKISFDPFLWVRRII